jgi:galactokinase
MPESSMSVVATDLSVVRGLGLGAEATERSAMLLTQARQALGTEPTWAWWVPGRIEVLGKHTDYAGGQVLNCATDVGLVVVARPRRDAVVRVHSNGQTVEVPLAVTATGHGGMSTYIAAVARRLARHFPGITTGVDLGIAANLPAASGMSSSSALVIAVHLALAEANRLRERPEYRAGLAGEEDLVPYLGCHENGASYRQFTGEAGVGTSGGSQDHAAILLSRAGHLNQWSFSPFHRLGAVAWPDDLVLTVAVSGVLAEKTAATRTHFNRVSDRVRAAAAAWNATTGRSDASIGAAVLACGASTVLAAITDPDLRLRAEQTIIETTEIVPGAVAALAAGDAARFGALTARSQAMADTHLMNQVPETIALVAGANQHGAVAASSFGAGFGGAVWAAFRRDHDGSAAWLADYRRRFPQHAHVATLHHITPGPGATALGIA